MHPSRIRIQGGRGGSQRKELSFRWSMWVHASMYFLKQSVFLDVFWFECIFGVHIQLQAPITLWTTPLPMIQYSAVSSRWIGKIAHFDALLDGMSYRWYVSLRFYSLHCSQEVQQGRIASPKDFCMICSKEDLPEQRILWEMNQWGVLAPWLHWWQR